MLNCFRRHSQLHLGTPLPPPLPHHQGLQQPFPRSDFLRGELGRFPGEDQFLMWYPVLSMCSMARRHIKAHENEILRGENFCNTCTILMVAGAEGSRTSTYFCKSTPPFIATKGTFTWRRPTSYANKYMYTWNIHNIKQSSPWSSRNPESPPPKWSPRLPEPLASRWQSWSATWELLWDLN